MEYEISKEEIIDIIQEARLESDVQKEIDKEIDKYQKRAEEDEEEIDEDKMNQEIAYSIQFFLPDIFSKAIYRLTDSELIYNIVNDISDDADFEGAGEIYADDLL